MDVIENTLEVDLDTFLARPLFCFLATTEEGAPRVSPLWFLWEDGAIWMIGDTQKTYPERVEQHSETALAIVDFDRADGTVQHVGMRGRATLEPHDPDRAERLLAAYLGPDKREWDRTRFPDPAEWGEEMIFVRFQPATVVARDESYVPAPGVTD